MTEELTIFSTVEDLRSCSNDVLVAGIDTVGKEVILAYILELRERLNQSELQTEFGKFYMYNRKNFETMIAHRPGLE